MPDPMQLATAASLASRAVAGLYELVRVKFATDQAALAVLTAAQGAAPDSPQVRALGEVLDRAAAADPEFAARLREQVGAPPVTQTGRVTNYATNVHGSVVQAGDITGGITLNFK